VVAGQATWTLASTAGLTALLIASAPAFTALKLAGAAYLVWLGARSLYLAASGKGSGLDSAGVPGAARPDPRAALRQGLLSALGNPKLAVFFVSLLPQFVPQGRVSLPALLGLGLTFCAMTLVWLTAYAVIVERLKRLLDRSGIRRALEAALGATLMALGWRVAAEHR
jgi:threonine/homoserine/homoserine lactone efflux protein